MSHKILMVVAPEQFRDEELLVPQKTFESRGWQVEVVSTHVGEAKGMLGAVVNVQHDLQYAQTEALKDAYNAIIVVGGMGAPEFLWGNTDLHQLLLTLQSKNRVLAAICLSGAVLAETGLLNGKQATVWEVPETLETFKKNNVIYTAEPVTVDGNFITANGPDAAGQFAEAITERLTALLPA
jgi:protease I